MSSKIDGEGPVRKRRKVASAEEFVPLPTLSNELLLEIFKHLPVRKRIWMEQICKQWKDHLIPKSLRSVKSLDIRSDFCRNWAKWRSNAARSHLSGNEIFQKIIERIGNQLEDISFPGRFPDPCKFDVAKLMLLSSNCPNLKKLDLTGGVVVGSTAVERLGTELSQLESLSIRNCRWNGATERKLSVSVGLMSQLKELSVDGDLRGSFLRHLPDSVVSVDLHAHIILSMTDLAQFIRSHPGLKKFHMKTWDRDFDRICHETIELLAQRCAQLEQLSFSGSGSYYDGQLADDRSFAEAFESLTQLKKVKFDSIRWFNTAALKSLCANCPQLEFLSLHIWKPEDFGSEALACVGQLEKLKSLELDLPLVNDGHVDALMSGIGATLEYLDIQQAEVTDASLLQIGLNCSRLAHLVMRKGRNVSTAGLQGFIDAIVNQESWDDPLKNRRLRIDVRWCSEDWLKGINLEGYGGRVEINKIA